MTIVDAVREFVATELVKDPTIEMPEERPLIGHGLINSLGIMRLIGFLRDRFDLRFDDDDYKLENFETLGAIRRLIERRTETATV
jgi:acyl carrier protein